MSAGEFSDERWSLHHRGRCEFCCDAPESEFDYCRVCGFTVMPFSTNTTRHEALPWLKQAIIKARGGPTQPPLQKGFA